MAEQLHAEIRVVEVLAALSLTTDLASGVPFEKGLSTCLVADALAASLRLPPEQRRVVFQAALLRAVGCTGHAVENAAMFADDVAFQRALKRLDPGDPAVFGAQLRQFGDWAGAQQPMLSRRFLEQAPVAGPRAARAGCEGSRALGPRLGLVPAAVDALDEVYERWDGLGIPVGRAGDSLSLPSRVVHVAEQAVFAYAEGGTSAAVAEVSRRAGGHLDPDLAAAFVQDVDTVLAPLVEPDQLTAVVAAEPGPVATVPFGDLERLCLALATVVDLKGTFLLGHSVHVAELATAAAHAAGLDDTTCDAVRAAGLLHDLGRVAVSSEIWDRPGPLGVVDWERVRLHPYWTSRVLKRCPALASLSPLASNHHERTDGSGYHRGVRGADLPLAARILAAADVLAALTEHRPHRPALAGAEAAKVLEEEVRQGRLDPEACAACLPGAGLPAPRRLYPCDLTPREVDVLRLAARGWTNRQVAERLSISDRTVGHHLSHIYDKTGRRTRAGVAVFAVEHRLLPEPPPPESKH